MKNKRGIKLLSIFLLIAISAILNGYINIQSYPFYIYQWGLQNDGKLSLKQDVLQTNNNIEFFDVNISTNVFNGQDYNKRYFTNTTDQSFVLAKPGIDIDYSKANDLYNGVTNKQEIIVAVIDSGIDINHYELKNSIWINDDEIPANGIDDDKNGYIDDVCGYNFYDNNPYVYLSEIDDTHGTHAAGIIAAEHDNGGIKGIAYNTQKTIKIMPLKILGENEKGKVASLLAAIKYAHDNGAKICNISLGCYTQEPELESLIKGYNDMLFVVAAGNGARFIGYNIDERPVYPASYNFLNLITVSTLLFDGTAYVSGNFGLSVDVYAPGSYILSTAPNNRFGYLTGSSIACPFVTGVCAMMWSSNPTLNPQKIKKIISDTVNKNDSLNGFCFSGGSINAYKALYAALQ